MENLRKLKTEKTELRSEFSIQWVLFMGKLMSLVSQNTEKMDVITLFRLEKKQY
jgi:hypothetical protein